MQDRPRFLGLSGVRRAMRARWPIGVVAAVLAAVSLIVAATSATAGSRAPVRIAPAAQLPTGAQAAGSLPDSMSVSGSVVLKPRNQAKLNQFLAAVTNPKSALYHQYLSAGQYATKFGPTSATVQSVRSQLTAAGLTVTGTSDNGMLINFSAPASTVESAFSTHLAHVRLANGDLRRATTSAVKIPASISASVSSVIGLNSLVAPQPIQPLRQTQAQIGTHAAAKAASAFPHPAGAPKACGQASKAADVFGGLTDDQIANAYGAFGLYGAGDTGQGQGVAIFELEPFAPSDIATFDQCYFGTKVAGQMASRLRTIPVDGGQPTGPGSGEAVLDVEDVSAMAPGANIDVYEAPNTTFGSIDEYAQIANDDADQVVSTSWGLCEQALQQAEPGDQQAESQVFQQMAAQGQTIFSAAGDTGSDDCNLLRAPIPPSDQNPVSVDDPSAQPYVVGVGGTTILNAETTPATEQVWNDGDNFGGTGGGISQAWAMPSWQRNAQLPGIDLPGSADYTNGNAVETKAGFPTGFCQATAPAGVSNEACRLEPDVSAQADEFTGAVTIFSTEFNGDGPGGSGWITIGGTSSATPIWAGLLADINASASCKASTATANGVGFALPGLYGVASNPTQYAASFNDITKGNNDVNGFDNGLVFPARTGFDLASGLGSPRLTDANGTAGLAFYLCSNAAGASSPPSVTGLTPDSGSVAGGETVTVSGAGFKANGNVKVAGVQVGTENLPAADFTVNDAGTITITMPPAAQSLPPDTTVDGGGAVQIVVTLKNGQSSATSAASTFQYIDGAGSGNAVPDVTSVGPFGGSETAPTPVVIRGSGFTGASAVRFGGVNAASFTVNSPDRITATPPAFSSATNCQPLPTTGVYAGENATNDICQVQVKVTGHGGTSAVSAIAPPPEGSLGFTDFGIPTFPDCTANGCELGPAATEFDYTPAPTVTSISTSNGPASLASEQGTTVVTVKGSGFNDQTLDWTDFGDPTLDSSVDTNFVFLTGTEIQVVAPAQPQTADVLSVPFSVKTLAGESNQLPAQFAGVPTVTSVVNTQNGKTFNGLPLAPDTGGTPLKIHGTGFANQLIPPIQFNDVTGSGFASATQFNFTVNSDTSVSTQTVADNPGVVDVQLCTVSGCSQTSPADELLQFPLGDPQVDAVQPASGPAAGGTKVTVTGQNLSCPIEVDFGGVPAPKFAASPGFLNCGSATKLTATTPAHAAGPVPVTVQTAESFYKGTTGSSTATFTYK
jgi:hypothetical protein